MIPFPLKASLLQDSEDNIKEIKVLKYLLLPVAIYLFKNFLMLF